MIRPILHGIVLASTLAGGLSAAEPSASTPTSAPTTAQGTSTADAAATPMFDVYAASCSRSFEKVGSYRTIAEARRVAEQQRKTRRAWIATGKGSSAWSVLLRIGPESLVEGCSIYGVACRGGLQLQERVRTVKEADAKVAELNPTVQNLEIVYHLK